MHHLTHLSFLTLSELVNFFTLQPTVSSQGQPDSHGVWTNIEVIFSTKHLMALLSPVWSTNDTTQESVCVTESGGN